MFDLMSVGVGAVDDIAKELANLSDARDAEYSADKKRNKQKRWRYTAPVVSVEQLERNENQSAGGEAGHAGQTQK